MVNWFQEFVDRNILLNWDSEFETFGGKILVDKFRTPFKRLKKEWYLAIESEYSRPHQHNTPEESKRTTENWIIEFEDMVQDLPKQSRLHSGARSIAMITGIYPMRQSTTTDISMFAQEQVLEAYQKSLRPYGFILMKRKSGKPSKKSLHKYHFFKPVSPKEAINSRDYNLEFTRITENAINSEFIAKNHIRIYLHKNEGGKLICIEDKVEINYEKNYFRGVPVKINGTQIYVMDPRYTHQKLRQVVESHEKNYKRHLPDLKILENFLKRNSSDFEYPEEKFMLKE